MLLSTGERISLRAVRDGDQRPWAPGDLADGLAGGDRHRQLAHQGADPRCARGAHPAALRGGPHRAGGRVPGGLGHESRRHHAGPRRIGHDGRGAGRGAATRAVARSTPTWRGYSRADPRIVPDARILPQVSVSRRCWRWRLRARVCCSCARSSTRVTTACASTVVSSFSERPVRLWSAKKTRWSSH